jgi:hypothetical protein
MNNRKIKRLLSVCIDFSLSFEMTGFLSRFLSDPHPGANKQYP